MLLVATRWPTLLLVTLLVSCRSREDEMRRTLARDTALAAELARAADTALFSEAADIAVGSEPDAAGFQADSALAVAPPPMRVRRPPPSPAAVASAAPEPRGETTRSRAIREPVVSPASAPPNGSVTAEVPTGVCTSPARADQRRCLLLHLARSDVTLDRNYQALIHDLKADAGVASGDPEPESVQRLRAAQRAWLVYRDTECRRRNRGREGALWAPIRARCLAEFSARRADELAAARSR